MRSTVDAILAATAGMIIPGRTAIKNFNLSVTEASEDANVQGSSQDLPVGISTPVYPR